MKINWDNGCKTILIKNNSNKSFILKEDITMSKKKIYNITKIFDDLSKNPDIIK